MRTPISFALVLLACAVAGPGDAVADDWDGSGGSRGRGMVLAKGAVGFNLDINYDLSAGLGGSDRAVAFRPDVWFGLLPKLQIGLAHSPSALTGFTGGVKGSLCVFGSDLACPSLYDGPVGVLAEYEILGGGALAVAAGGGLVINGIDPQFQLGAKAGARVRFVAGAIVIVAAPSIFFEFADRTAGQDTVFLPITALYRLSDALALGVQSGISFTLENSSSNLVVPITAGVQFHVNARLWVGLAFSFLDVEEGHVDGRSATVWAGYVLGGGGDE